MAAVVLLLQAICLPLQAEVLKGYVLINGKQVAAEYTKVDEGTVSVGSGQNSCIPQFTEGFLTIPGEVTIGGKVYKVSEISRMAFRLCTKLTGVDIKEGVTRVGEFAFVGCKLADITLPASMKSLASGAFIGCLTASTNVTCMGTTPPRWEYNDVFMFHEDGIGGIPKLITASIELYVPDEAKDIYLKQTYENKNLGWTHPEGWNVFVSQRLGQAVYHVYTPFDLHALRDIVNYGHKFASIGEVVLEDDIDMTEYKWDSGMGVSEEEAFEGKFLGKGHTISNLTIDTDGFGGFFAHYGGHEISNVTFKNCTFSCDRADRTKYPNGVLGGVIGEGGYVYMFQVCLDHCTFISNFDQNGLLMGRCLTGGGANFTNCVLKDCSFKFNKPGYNGFLVGDCFGGSATDCALYRNEHQTMPGSFPRPFVGQSRNNEEFYVTRCYNTRLYYGPDDLEETNVLAVNYHPAANVIYSQVVLNRPRTVKYTDANGNPAEKQFEASMWNPYQYYVTLFMVAELGLEHWSYQEGECPVPAAMEHLLPAPRVNCATYRPASFLSDARVNGLSPAEHIPAKAWYDMSEKGYRSYSYATSRLWINDNFSPTNSTLPIGTATITAVNGIDFSRTLEVTPNGKAAYSLPNAVLDKNGKPMTDADGNYLTNGETTLYEYDVFKNTDYTLCLPYELYVNGGAYVYQPSGVRRQGKQYLLEMEVVKDGIIRPWQPYYIVVNNAAIRLSTEHTTVVEPRSKGVDYLSFDNDSFRMYGTPGVFKPASGSVYQLQEDDTWRVDDTQMLPFTCYLTNERHEAVDYFTPRVQLPLIDDGENESTIAQYDNSMVDAVLEGRTFYKDDTWYTLCLPFDVKSFDDTPLEDATVKRFSGSEYDANEGIVSVRFANATTIQAGVPYLVRWSQASRVKNPVFQNVIIKNVDLQADKQGPLTFLGTYSPVVLPEGSDRILYMGDDNRLFYPESAVTVNAFRAFFTLGGSASSSSVRQVKLCFDDDFTGIDDTRVSRLADDRWYTLDGRMLNAKPTAAGLYIHNGKTTVIK